MERLEIMEFYFYSTFLIKTRIIEKKKKSRTLMDTGLFRGPSDWSRTSGLLNPIQARYQTAPHPDLLFSALLLYHSPLRISSVIYIFSDN